MNAAGIERALVEARKVGYLEVLFTSDDISGFVDEPHPPHPLTDRWEMECAASGRHAVTVVRVRDDYFVAVSFRFGDEMEYVLASMLGAFREHFGVNPGFDPDVGVGFFGPLVARGAAIEAARELVAIDVEPRDADVELAYHVMSS